MSLYDAILNTNESDYTPTSKNPKLGRDNGQALESSEVRTYPSLIKQDENIGITGATPAVPVSAKSDTVSGMDQASINNLVRSLIDDQNIPNVKEASEVLNDIHLSDKVKTDINALTGTLLKNLREAKDSVSAYTVAREYSSKVEDLVAQSLIQENKGVAEKVKALDSTGALTNEKLQVKGSDYTEPLIKPSDKETSEPSTFEKALSRIPETAKSLNSTGALTNDELQVKGSDYTEPLAKPTDNKTPESSTFEKALSHIPETAKSLENTSETIKKEFTDTQTVGTLARETLNATEAVKDGYNPDTATKNITSPVEDAVVGLVSSVVSEPIKTILNSDAVKALENPTALIRDTTSRVVSRVTDYISSTMTSLVKVPVEAVDSVLNAATEFGEDLASNTVNKVLNDTVGKVSTAVASEANRLRDKALLQLDSSTLAKEGLGKAKSSVKEAVMKGVGPDYGLKLKGIIPRAVTNAPVSRSDFKINTGDLSLFNDMYWDVKIEPHNFNGVEPPDLNSYYGLEGKSGGRLPIISFSLNAGGVGLASFELYRGAQLSIPLEFSRPSSFSCSIVNLVRQGSKVESCLDSFKTAFIKHVVGDTSDLTQIPACLDYRYCTYEITVSKFSPRWQPLKTWYLLGIPVVNFEGEAGASSSSVEIQNLSFSIVGDGVD